MSKKGLAGVCTCLIIVIILISGYRYHVNSLSKVLKAPKAVNGQIDLSNWNFENDGVVKLDGQWEFYWKNQKDYKNISSNNQNLIKYTDLPGIWLKDKNNKYTTMFGYATYSLKVKVSSKDEILSLIIPEIQTSNEVYINDKLVSLSGKPGTEKTNTRPELKPNVISFIPPAKEFYIIIHVSNYYGSLGGIWEPIIIGDSASISNMWNYKLEKDFFLSGSIIIMAIYYFSIYIMRKKEREALYFSLICMIVAIRISVLGTYPIYLIFPSVSYSLITLLNFITIYWGPTIYSLYILQMFAVKNSKNIKKALLIFTAAETIFTITTPVYIYTHLTLYYDAAGILIILFSLFISFKGMLKKKGDGFIIFLSSIGLILAFLYDTLFEFKMVNGLGEITPFAFFICVLLQSVNLGKRFSRDYKKSVNLSAKLEQMLKNEKDLTQKLTRLDKVKDEFLANTSHELKTPLNGIINITESVIAGASGAVNEEQKENLTIVATNAKRLMNLINDILDISKLKNRDIKLNIKTFHIKNCIYSVLQMFKYINTKPQLQINANIDENIPCVLADEERFEQIMYNLIGNAIKFTPSGSVNIYAEDADDYVRIIVEDTGIGIENKDIERIWNPFEQIDSSVIRKNEGAGLGLSITKYLVNLHGGIITVDSKEGLGTKFMFTLPKSSEAALENDDSIVKRELINNNHGVVLPQTIVQNGAKILVVDDDIANLYSIVNFLKIDGFSVVAANSGYKALQELDSINDYALVILDVMMPEVSGYEVCKKIREKYTLYELPVLMLTANNQLESILMSFKEGANDFIAKPFNSKELLARVSTLVKLKESVNRALELEMAFLQAQIKPHFLFNVLNTIAALCDIDSAEAGELIIELSKYLRGSFDFSNLESFIPLEKELTHVESYLKLEKARFGDKLNIVYAVEKMTNIKIPPLILQPIVENSVKHGIAGKNQGGTIKISIYSEGKGTVISVWDNGKGIPKEKIDGLFTSNREEKSVGLYNINMRLKRLYGKGIEIESIEGVETRTKIFIPKA